MPDSRPATRLEALYQRLFCELELVDSGSLSEREGRWDDLTYWVFEKRG